MKTIEAIETYRYNIRIIVSNGDYIDYTFDGQEQLFTRSEFVDGEDWMQDFSSSDQQRIMDAIDSCYNVDFFLHENPLTITIAEQIRDIRKYNGMTLQELADKAGSSTKSISRIENGQQDLTITLANKLLNAMGHKLTVTKQ